MNCFVARHHSLQQRIRERNSFKFRAGRQQLPCCKPLAVGVGRGNAPFQVGENALDCLAFGEETNCLANDAVVDLVVGGVDPFQAF